jgi:hypothetical protein
MVLSTPSLFVITATGVHDLRRRQVQRNSLNISVEHLQRVSKTHFQSLILFARLAKVTFNATKHNIYESDFVSQLDVSYSNLYGRGS